MSKRSWTCTVMIQIPLPFTYFILLGTGSVMKVFSHSVTDVLWILWPSGPAQEQEMKNEELRGVLFRI